MTLLQRLLLLSKTFQKQPHTLGILGKSKRTLTGANRNRNQVIENPQAVEEKKMYFKLFMLNPIKVNITFNMTADSSTETKY